MMRPSPNTPIEKISIPLAGATGGYIGQQLDPARTINMYVAEVPGQPTAALIAFPGTQTVVTNPSGTITRNLFQTGKFLFAVYSNQVVIYDTSLSTSVSFTINTTDGVANFTANNNHQVMLVDGVDGWVFDISSTPTVTQITDSFFTSFSNPLDVAYLNGHIFVVFGSGNKWIISNFEDALNYNPLHQAEITSSGNQFLTGVKVSSSRIYFFGTSISEVWYPTNQATDFPFARDSNSTISFGCSSTTSLQAGAIQVKSLYRIFPDVENAVIWVGAWPQGTPKVIMSSMGTTSVISDEATEYKIQQLSTVSDARGILLSINGMTFYILTFPTGNLSLLYNFDQKMWTELQMLDENFYFASCHAIFNNTNYLGSFHGATLSKMDNSLCSNDADAIHCVRITPIFNLPSYERLSISRLEIEARSGTGLATAPLTSALTYDTFNLEPQIFCSHSLDGGYHFSQPREVTSGAVGEAQWKIFWQGFPVSARHVFKIESFNATKTIWLNAFVTLQNLGY